MLVGVVPTCPWYGKAFIAHKHSHSKPVWVPSYPIPGFPIPNNISQVVITHLLTFCHKTSLFFIFLLLLKRFLEHLFSKLAKVIITVLSQTHNVSMKWKIELRTTSFIIICWLHNSSLIHEYFR